MIGEPNTYELSKGNIVFFLWGKHLPIILNSETELIAKEKKFGWEEKKENDKKDWLQNQTHMKCERGILYFFVGETFANIINFTGKIVLF